MAINLTQRIVICNERVMEEGGCTFIPMTDESPTIKECINIIRKALYLYLFGGALCGWLANRITPTTSSRKMVSSPRREI